MKIAVIVLHYRNLCDTLECLRSLFKQDYLNYEVILIDNGSQETALVDALKSYPKIHFLQHDKNLGFAEGNNRGIAFALKQGFDAVLLLNNDTVVAENLLSSFAEAAAQNTEAALFGAKILYYDDPTTIWHAGGNVNLRTMRCYHEGCPDSDLEKKWDDIREINYACACALFVKREAIEKVGLMASEFFLLWEEIDWCWRMRKMGYRCLYVPKARVWHKVSRAFDGGNRGALWQYYYFRNRLLFIQRNIPLTKRLFFYFTHFPKELLQILSTLLNPRSSKQTRKLYLAALRGIKDHFLCR